MNYTEIFEEVRETTNRYDIDTKVRAAIRETTLRAHLSDFYFRDRVEAQIQWPTDETLVDVNVLSYLPRFRQINYARYWNPSDGALGNMLKWIDPRDVLDDYNYEKKERYYIAGDVLKLKFIYPTRGVQVGYFCTPIVHPYTTYQSWIAEQFPDIIIRGAVALIYNQTGKQEEAKAINQEVGFEIDPGRSPTKGLTLLQQLQASNLIEVAR